MEDNQLLRWWLSVTLGQQGFEVVAPASADELIAVLGAERFDVLVTDCNLDECRDGFHVLTLVRERDPRILAILISAQTDPNLPGRALAAGFDAFLPKPIRASEIAEAILGRQWHGPAEATL